jgi:catalase (peroxidase I)
VTIQGRDFYLGPWKSKASYVEYDRLIGEWLANGRQLPRVLDAGLDITELVAAYWQFAEGYYVKDSRPTCKPARGRYRRLMQTRFNEAKYHRRAQVKTVISMIKRRQGNHARGRTYQAQCRDLRLMALTHNVMILLRVEVFY